MTPELLRFWERAGFVLARVGFRKDTASGSRSVVQVKALSVRAHVLFKGLEQ
jgi:tRNA(Met) cytidine acetyltransferase